MLGRMASQLVFRLFCLPTWASLLSTSRFSCFTCSSWPHARAPPQFPHRTVGLRKPLLCKAMIPLDHVVLALLSNVSISVNAVVFDTCVLMNYKNASASLSGLQNSKFWPADVHMNRNRGEEIEVLHVRVSKACSDIIVINALPRDGAGRGHVDLFSVETEPLSV